MSKKLRNFLTLSYEELEQLNLKAKEQARPRCPAQDSKKKRLKLPHGRRSASRP